MTKLLLVRHGQSVAQVEGVVGGKNGCRGLSDLGREQVRLLADRWRKLDMTADVLLSSTLPRAVETAEILAEVLGLPVDQHEGLCEILPGEYDGMAWQELEDRFRGGDYRWDAHTPLAPGGESWVAFMDRVSATITEVIERHQGRTIVASVHGGVVDGSIVHFLGLPKDAGNVLDSTNSSVTEWEHSERPWRAGAGWRLRRFNDAAHLENL